MPYCCRCGKETRDTDTFCGVCGAAQPNVKAPPGDSFNPRTASILCYIPVLGWIPAVIALASQRFRNDKVVRFHAFQGIYLFVIYLIVDWFLGPMLSFSHWPRGGDWHVSFPAMSVAGILKICVWVAWVIMLIKTSKGEQYRLPVLGELADRSVAEQK